MNIENVLIALQMMWKGMLGIFIVIIIIMLVVMLLSKITKNDTNQDGQK